jgi:hypothetical protein
LFNIAINTAVASMKTLAQTPLPAGLPLLLMTIAMGAVQAGLVLARPIPKYAKGTQSAERAGIFGEAGREIMFPLSGGTIMADKPTYFEGSKFKGAKILSNPETERMMGMADRRIQGTQVDDRLLNEMREVKKAILSKPVAIYDHDHRVIGQKMGTHQEIYLNRLTR